MATGKWKRIADRIRQEAKVYRLVLKDKRTPKRAKLFLWLAVGYALSPVDLIPDFIPLIGQLDDLIIVPVLVTIALRMIPKEVIADCRARVNTI